MAAERGAVNLIGSGIRYFQTKLSMNVKKLKEKTREYKTSMASGI